MHVTVCICTRDRGSRITPTLLSVAASTHSDFDAIVVDQSVGDDTEAAIRKAIAHDTRFRYIRSETVGASACRNVAIAHARGPIVAFTDDDCTVAPDWLSHFDVYFRALPHVGEICGQVLAGQHSATAGFIPTFQVRRPTLISSPWKKWREGGIGANMAFRLDILRGVGLFDEILGPGTSLPSCEEGDLTYRVLLAGYAVLDVPDAYVIHHGFRTWHEGRILICGTAIGVGAAYMKHLRVGDYAIVPTLLIEWIRCISWNKLLTFRKHWGARRFLCYARGIVMSFRFDVDHQTRLYVSSARGRTRQTVES